MGKHDYKQELALWLVNEYGEAIKSEWRFHAHRRWRFDYAIPDIKVAVEFDGVVSQAAHTSITNVLNDSAKFNEAALLGWIVIRCNTPNLRDGSGYDAIEKAVKMRRNTAA